jgi:hypothetical protein
VGRKLRHDRVEVDSFLPSGRCCFAFLPHQHCSHQDIGNPLAHRKITISTVACPIFPEKLHNRPFTYSKYTCNLHGRRLDSLDNVELRLIHNHAERLKMSQSSSLPNEIRSKA